MPTANNDGPVLRLFERNLAALRANNRFDETWHGGCHHHHQRFDPKRYGLAQRRRNPIAPAAAAINQHGRFKLAARRRNTPNPAGLFETRGGKTFEKPDTQGFAFASECSSGARRIRITIARNMYPANTMRGDRGQQLEQCLPINEDLVFIASLVQMLHAS